MEIEAGFLKRFDLEVYQTSLLEWGYQHFREFPWRVTNNPYLILIAETLLHRTQAKQVVEIYLKFIEKYPDVEVLSRSSYEGIEECLKPLGLSWRTRLVQTMAKQIMDRYGGKIPIEKFELMKLPGIGEYIASSVRCFGFGFPEPIVDTNVMRVITRLLGIQFRDSLRRNKKFLELANKMMDARRPREYNFAILDLAYLVCRPKNPKCKECPINSFCAYSD